MKKAQKESYKADYALAKADGKPFFPYAIYKDHIVALAAITIVIILAIAVRVRVGEPIDPATTTFVPRPEWYFFFLFDLLRIFKNQNVFMPVIMATFIVPNILMALLFLVPFIDRGPERRIQKRPFALMSGLTVIFLLAYLTYLGATAPEPLAGGSGPTLSNLDAQGKAGLTVFLKNPCASCHMIKGVGGAIGPDLTNEGSKAGRDKQWQIDHLKDPPSKTPGSAMPAFANLTPKEYDDLATFLTGLGTKYK
ncbi:MAG: c-type cytochrome [Actinobacteria bacterium]|nr:c-type cytochrome [Actinomycetota bacterium]